MFQKKAFLIAAAAVKTENLTHIPFVLVGVKMKPGRTAAIYWPIAPALDHRLG
jgi:hypothetical protein